MTDITTSWATALDTARRECGDDLNAHHEAALRCANGAYAHAYCAGSALLAAKAQHKHGHWGAYVRALPFAASTAAKYMKFARGIDSGQISTRVEISGGISGAIAAMQGREPKALPAAEPLHVERAAALLREVRDSIDFESMSLEECERVLEAAIQIRDTAMQLQKRHELQLGALRPHEYNAIFPRCQRTVDAIAGNMRRHDNFFGVHDWPALREEWSIVLYEGKILDGKLRYAAALQAEVVPAFVDFEGDDADALTFVEIRNLRRGHFSETQRAAAALLAARREAAQ